MHEKLFHLLHHMNDKLNEHERFKYSKHSKKNTKETYDSPESNITTNIPRHEHEYMKKKR